MGLFDIFKKKKVEVEVDDGHDYEKLYNWLIEGLEAMYSRSLLQRYGLSDDMTRELIDGVKNIQMDDLDLEKNKSDYKKAFYRLAEATVKLYTEKKLQGFGISDDLALDIVNEASGFSKTDLQNWQPEFLDVNRVNENQPRY